MIVGFDFDSTLATHRIQRVAKKFISDGHEVWIVTTRTATPNHTVGWNNDKLFEIAEILKIPQERIIFTEGEDKFTFLEGFDMFFDDDEVEVELIEENVPECTPVLITPIRYV